MAGFPEALQAIAGQGGGGLNAMSQALGGQGAGKGLGGLQGSPLAMQGGTFAPHSSGPFGGAGGNDPLLGGAFPGFGGNFNPFEQMFPGGGLEPTGFGGSPTPPHGGASPTFPPSSGPVYDHFGGMEGPVAVQPGQQPGGGGFAPFLPSGFGFPGQPTGGSFFPQLPPGNWPRGEFQNPPGAGQGGYQGGGFMTNPTFDNFRDFGLGVLGGMLPGVTQPHPLGAGLGAGMANQLFGNQPVGLGQDMSGGQQQAFQNLFNMPNLNSMMGGLFGGGQQLLGGKPASGGMQTLPGQFSNQTTIGGMAPQGQSGLGAIMTGQKLPGQQSGGLQAWGGLTPGGAKGTGNVQGPTLGMQSGQFNLGQQMGGLQPGGKGGLGSPMGQPGGQQQPGMPPGLPSGGGLRPPGGGGLGQPAPFPPFNPGMGGVNDILQGLFQPGGINSAKPLFGAPKVGDENMFDDINSLFKRGAFQPNRIGTPGIQGEVERRLMEMLGRGGLSQEYVDAARNQVLRPQIEALEASQARRGGGAANIASGIFEEQRGKQENAFSDNLTRTGFENYQNTLAQSMGLGAQQFGQDLSQEDLALRGAALEGQFGGLLGDLRLRHALGQGDIDLRTALANQGVLQGGSQFDISSQLGALGQGGQLGLAQQGLGIDAFNAQNQGNLSQIGGMGQLQQQGAFPGLQQEQIQQQRIQQMLQFMGQQQGFQADMFGPISQILTQIVGNRGQLDAIEQSERGGFGNFLGSLFGRGK